MGEASLIVPSRFCGPPSSGNGGWTAGALASFVPDAPRDRAWSWPSVEVSLRLPPPLEVPLAVGTDGESTTATHEGRVVGTARATQDDPVPVEPVSHAEASRVADTFPGHASHPFPTCFVCGTGREEGDGLRIFPGAVEPGPEGRARVAAAWTPHPSLREDFHHTGDEQPRVSLSTTWAALDCAGAWAGDVGERLMVLARMTARIDTLPVIGEPHVVLGEERGAEGRKTWSATTLYDGDGRVVGGAEQLWISIDRADFS